MKRTIVGLSIFACLTMGVVVSGSLTAPAPRINPETFGEIKLGMTEQEVEACLGVPPISSEFSNLSFYDSGAIFKLGFRLSDNGPQAATHGLMVFFNGEGKVSEARRCIFHHDETFSERFRRWLHLPWW